MKVGARTIWKFVILSIALFMVVLEPVSLLVPRRERPAEAPTQEPEILVPQPEAA